MARVHRQQADEGILDQAAALFAQHGFAHTSLKSVADAVGLSKAGLLHHFPSKEALFVAAREVVGALGQRILDQVEQLPPGPMRDRRALELLTEVALDRPGLVSLAFRVTNGPGPDGITGDAMEDQARVFDIFALDPIDGDTARLVRVIGALSALAMLCLIANQRGDKAGWRPLIIATCFDALGHGQAFVPAED
ncbi:TetR/AcrR family transcriptional regulator [Crossiella sp. NPDC003009]